MNSLRTVSVLALPMAAWLTLLGCSSGMPDNATDDVDGDTGEERVDSDTDVDALRGFYIAVEPASETVRGQTVLPRRFGPYLGDGTYALEIQAAVTVRGTVVGETITPWAFAGQTALPIERVPVQGLLRFRDGSAQVDTVTRSDADGTFEIPLHPGLLSLSIVPDDPALPVDVRPVPAFDPLVTLDLDIGRGVPLWGRVRDGNGAPIPSAGVIATTLDGLTTSSATTDDAGWYELRVQPGIWRVVTTGPVGGREPTLTSLPAEVGDEGSRVDLAYRPSQRADLTLRVVDGDARALSGMPVRLTSIALDGYGLGVATYTIQTTSDSRGFIDARVPDGVYELSIEPLTDDPFGGRRVDTVEVRGESDLGAFSLSGLVRLSIEVVDEEGEILPGAIVQCVEVDGRGRSWLGRADDLGVAELTVPRAPARCTGRPPGDRPELADTTVELADPLTLETLVLSPGTPVTGSIGYLLPDGLVPGSLATVLVLDGRFETIAIGLADTEGRFTVQLPSTWSLDGTPTDPE